MPPAQLLQPQQRSPKPASELWRVHDRYYDLTDFIDPHPGGEMVLRQSIGMDITALVESHHFDDRVWKKLAMYKVASPASGQIESCGYTFRDDGFFRTLKRRLVTSLGRAGVRAGPPATYGLRVAATFLFFFFSWWWCCFRPLSFFAVAVAVLTRSSLIGIGHEAIHGRYGGALFHLFDFAFLFPSERWHFEHVLLHHPHCKREGIDPDEDMDPLLRLSPASPWKPHHRFQVYVQFVVAFLASVGTYVENHLVNRNQFCMGTAFLAFHLAPLLLAPDGGLVAVVLVNGMSAFITLHAFHVSHITETTATYDFHADVDWGEHQMRTTVNWATAWWELSGMLEHQLEHHLFPSLPYDLQRKNLRPILRRTAKEFGLPYTEFPNWWEGVAAHLRHMGALGKKDHKKAALKTDLPRFGQTVRAGISDGLRLRSQACSVADAIHVTSGKTVRIVEPIFPVDQVNTCPVV